MLSVWKKPGDYDRKIEAAGDGGHGKVSARHNQRPADSFTQNKFLEYCCYSFWQVEAVSMGMRGPHAVPLVSMWRARIPSKPPLKRHCRRCDKLFTPKRHDAVYCSGKCRIAIYRLRLADDAKGDERPIFVVHFRPEPGIDGPRAFKSLLKFALRC
jgi:hypothetical protein